VQMEESDSSAVSFCSGSADAVVLEPVILDETFSSGVEVAMSGKGVSARRLACRG
jgi:hypothetical protein